jgi:hypothetical protein
MDEENMDHVAEKLMKKGKEPKKKLNDGEKILGNESRSVQFWKNLPRFHQDIINGNNQVKKKKRERLERSLKRNN